MNGEPIGRSPGANSVMLDAALGYARMGWRVLPIHHAVNGVCACPKGAKCDSAAKHPLTAHGCNDATTDEATIRRWWSRWPSANVAVATGAESGVVVIDLDPRHGGNENFAALGDRLGPLPDTVTALTGGGRHLFFKFPDGADIGNASGIGGYCGVDVRGRGGYVVVEPSGHVNGNAYAFELSSDPLNGFPPADLPGAWVEFLSHRGRATVREPVNTNEADGANQNQTLHAGSRNTALTRIAGAMRRHGSDVETIRAALLAENTKRCIPPLSETEVAGIAASVGRYKPADANTPTTPRPWVPFPTERLSKPVERFVTATADALGCDPTMVAMPTLSVLGSAIGTSRVIALKGSWVEPPVIWACVVARSGTLKSPAMDAAVKPLHDAQLTALVEYKRAVADYEKALLWYDREKADWKKKAASEPPEEPEPPVCVRFTLADTTIEALATILPDNPRGVLVARDEAAGWVRSFNQYKSKGGADAAAWLELWRAGTLIVDRKTGVPRTIFVRRAAGRGERIRGRGFPRSVGARRDSRTSGQGKGAKGTGRCGRSRRVGPGRRAWLFCNSREGIPAERGCEKGFSHQQNPRRPTVRPR